MQIPQIGCYDFHLEAKTDLHLPEYKGSTFRGGFGITFKRIVCALKRETCDECMLRSKCIYAYVFDTAPPPESDRLRHHRNIPQPFILEPPGETTMYYPPGRDLSFSFVLVGKALEFVPYFIYTVEEMGKTGIGKGRGLFTLKEVSSRGADGPVPVFDGKERKLMPGKSELQPMIEKKVEALSKATRIVLTFHTPTRIVSDDRFVSAPEFHHIIRSLSRRISNLLYFHCGMEAPWDFTQLIEKAEKVRVVDSTLEWNDWERYSKRQDTRMKMGGFTGTMVCEGEFASSAFVLALGELLHVGKNASFGLGKYQVETQ
ncbi:MAG: CRISPR system precrRNA processing endoribonuclease RAMP protein Cas6 [Vulcanimicrobiota bacterium]